jgi:MYXO-CTERM domain-containing protein
LPLWRTIGKSVWFIRIFKLALIASMKFQTNTTNETGGHGVTSPEILLKRKLAGYLAGAAGTAAMLGVHEAQAAVVYWSPTNWIGGAGPGNPVTAGLDGGFTFEPLTGIVGAAVDQYTVPISGFTVWNYSNSGSGNFVQLLGDTPNPTVGPAVGYDAISNLALSTPIGMGSTFGDYYSDGFVFFDYKNFVGYPWNTGANTTGYVGLQFKNGANTHYGWARFTYDDLNTGFITIHEFAYENQPGQSILAGDTGSAAVPEPSRALLALAGLCGVALRRRRKQAA